MFTQNDYYAQQFKKISGVSNFFSTLTFEDCRFESCDFSEASFNNCQFLECDFVNCNFSLAKFKGTRLQETTFNECKLLGIDWTLINWPSVVLDSLVSFERCVLNDSSFYGLTLQRLKLLDCRCYEVDFREGDFNHANFSHSDFTRSLFSRTNLTAANFSEALNYDIEIENNRIKGAKFSRYEAVRLLNSLEIELVD
ncbi:MAG: pentapeptide repeat-containing protein [Oceanospirillaceae bacterium]